MKKYVYIAFTFISFIVYSFNVNAGICDKKNQDYCSQSVTFKSANQIYTGVSASYYKGYFMRTGYNTSNDKMAICLDPGLKGVTGKTMNNVRSLDLSYEYDKNIYKLYQYLLNDIMYDASQINSYRAAFEFVTRMLTVKSDYSIYLDKYKSDFGSFVKCASKIDNSMSIEFGNDLEDSQCFGDYKGLVETYFNRLSQNYIWENPLEKSNAIETKVIKPSESANGKWEYQFKVNFGDFFTNSYSSAIKASNLNLSEASFSYDIYVNGTKCDGSGNCKTTDFTGGGTIAKSTSGEITEKTISIKFTDAEHSAAFPSGAGKIELRYKYGHPMLDDNIFIARTTVDEALEFQRMLVVDNYLREGVSTNNVGSGVIECKQEGSVLKYGDTILSIEDYKTQCGCDKINYDNLNDSDKVKYPSVCPYDEAAFNEDAQSFMYACSGNVEDYTVKYTKSYGLENNGYCTTSCTEDIKIDNMVSKNYYDNNPFTAGFHYILPGMKSDDLNDNKLSVTGTKKCIVTINYNSWYAEYLVLLNNVRDTYNNWKKFTNCSPSYTTCDCDCSGENCCGTKQYYSCSYYKSVVDIVQSPNILKSESYLSYNNPGYCDGSPADDADYYDDFYTSAVTKLQNHISKLKSCYSKMEEELGNTTTSDEVYYNFQSELEYHYQQKYSKYEYVWNHERVSRIGDTNTNDEKLTKYVSDYYTETSLDQAKINSTTDTSMYYPNVISSYSNNVDSTELIGDKGYYSKSNSQQYVREVTYRYYYRPSVGKYIDAFTGKITDENGKNTFISNPIKLGYYYDLDISAVAKDKNQNYYIFTELGDDGRISEMLSDEQLTRKCEYIITNDLVECKGTDCKLNVNYRSVDPSNIDPNDRLLESDKGFSNWKNDKGYAVKKQIEKRAETNDTYNPENLEYSFTLDSATIAAIRDYNKGKTYDNFAGYFECDDDGNKCESSFINQAKLGQITNSSGAYMDSFATINKGRDSWKVFSQSLGKYYIDGEEVE